MKYILIVSGGLQVGGAEKVAANICLYSNPEEFEFHYIVFEGIENVYGKDIERFGGKVFTVPTPSKNIWKYYKFLKTINNKYHYSAIHSHTMFSSGISLLIAKLLHIKCRIAHSHTTKTETKVSFIQKVYEMVMCKIINMCTTDFLACGNEAGNWLFGEKVFTKKGIVIKNGIDTEIYSYSVDNKNKIRDKLGIIDRYVIGHSGTILPLKNQKFLVELMPSILEVRNNAVLLLMGAGNEENTKALKEVINQCGVEEKVILCGCLDNVYEYLSALDIFAFPSTREGTPLALIEAQTNGLQCVISDVIPDDAILTDLVTKVSLQDKETWVDLLCSGKRNFTKAYNTEIASKGYDIRGSMEKIYEIYREQ